MDYNKLIVDEGLLTIISNLSSWLEKNGSSFDGSDKEYLSLEAKRLLAAVEALSDEA